MSKYLGYEQTGFANSTVSVTRASVVDTAGLNYANTILTTLYLPFNDDVNDDSPLSQTITNRGSMTVDSTYTKFGSNALKSQTSGSLKIDNSSSTDLDGPFTVEFFFYITTAQSQKTLYVHNENNSTYSGLLFWITSAGNFNGYAAENNSWNIFTTKTFASSVTTGTWHHVAITYDGTTYRGYYDGDRKWEVTNSTTIPTGGDHYIFSRNDGGQYQPATGQVYMDDFRITKGKALYTDSTYTVPTSALGIQQEDPVSLYLPFDSDVNDDSSHSHTVTASGSATISSTQSKFGGNSLSLNGTSQYLTVPNNDVFDFGSEDFTIEMWIYMTSNAGSSAGDRHGLVARRAADGNRSFHVGIQLDGGQQKLQFSHTTGGSGGSQTNYDTDIQLNTWTHVAIVRSGSKVYAFVDGVKNGSEHNISTNIIYAGTSDLTIGYRAESSQYFPGYIDDLRISKGVARYTKSFVPPSQAVGATLNGVNETNTTTDFTTLYLPFDSDLQDDSSSSHSVTATGGAAISSAQSKFGGYSALFDGTNDYLSIPSSSDFNFDSDFTIEFFIYPNNNNNYMLISHRASSVNFTLEMHRNTTGDIEFFAGSFSGTNPVVSTTINGGFTDAWHHVAITRVGNIFRLFFDGELKNTATQSVTFNTSAELRIGADNHPSIGSRFFFNGYIDDFRILTGYAKYTADFVPPTTAVTTSVSETVNDLTVLYMPFDSTEQTSSVAASQTSLYLPFDSDTNDDSAQSHTVTNNGVTISSAQSKFGGYSALFDGTNDYLSIPSDSSLVFGSEDFTVEFFLYLNDDTFQTPFSHRSPSPPAGAGDWTLPLNRTVAGQIEWYNGDYSVSSAVVSTTISGGFSGGWHHIAITRSGDTHRIFFDGELKASATNSSSYSSGPSQLHIGRDNYVGGRYYVDGYLEDIRIIKGTALYTESFTVPTSAVGATGTAISVVGGFEDLARNNVVTKEGDSTLNTSVKKFGTSSAYFAGNSSTLLNINHSGDLSFGGDDFTIEAWVYPTSVSGNKDIICDRPTTTYGGFLFYQTGSSYRFYSSTVISNSGSWNISNNKSLGTASINTWTHLAVTRESGVFRCFQDGVLQSTFSSSEVLPIGSRVDIASRSFAGYIDDVRIIKGKAIYTEAFTAPTSAHGHVSLEETSSTSETYSDTKFLSGVWDIRDAESKIQDGEWIRNDSDTGSVPSGLIIKGAGLEAAGHRWYVAPTNAPGVEILAVGAGGDGGNNQKSGGNTVFTHSGTGEYILAVGGGSAGPAGGGVGRAGGGGGGFVTATDLILDKDVSYTLTVGASGAVTESPLPAPSPAYPGGSGGGGTYVSGGVGRAGGTGVQPSTPQPLISGIPGASNFQNLGYDGAAHPPNGDNPGADQGPARGGGGGGTASSITGTSLTYAGGGYSGNRGGPTSGLGNAGPGGNGNSGPGNGGPGTRGGGGGGAGASGPTGGSGGPGVFVIAYPDSENTLAITGTLAYSQPSRSGYRVYYFTSGTGTITLSD